MLAQAGEPPPQPVPKLPDWAPDPALGELSVGCNRYAAPYGRDRRRGRRAGTRRWPYRTVPRLASSLRRGQTGCLLPGRYQHGRPAVIRRPRVRLIGLGGLARVDGAIWIGERATGAEVRGLSLTASDSTFYIPLKVQADRARILRNRIRSSRSTSCVLIGSTRRTHGVRIEGNWIRRCGRRGKLDHLIYVQNASRTLIRRNVLNANRGGWAVHLYPNADRTDIVGNLIDGNRGGVIFAGEGDETSDGNVVRSNVISFSSPRWNIEGSWDSTLGSGNVAFGNCLYSEASAGRAGVGSPVGFTLGPNAVVPRSPYRARSTRSYEFDPSGPCAEAIPPLPPAFGGR